MLHEREEKKGTRKRERERDVARNEREKERERVQSYHCVSTYISVDSADLREKLRLRERAIRR